VETAPDPEARSDSTTPPGAWLVDGYNVIQVTLLGGTDRSGWWRREARERLVERARALPEHPDRVFLVFDGTDPKPPPAPGDPGPHVVFAPSADEWILRRARQCVRDRVDATVVTADRRLADRCRSAGARVVQPGEFIAACRPAGEETAADGAATVTPPGDD